MEESDNHDETAKKGKMWKKVTVHTLKIHIYYLKKTKVYVRFKNQNILLYFFFKEIKSQIYVWDWAIQ